jgi:Prolyl-tRNA synthetase
MDASFTNAAGEQDALWDGLLRQSVSPAWRRRPWNNHTMTPASAGRWRSLPFQVIVVVANLQDATQRSLGDDLYARLMAQGVDALLDDRQERAGVKFKDADLIGIPWRIVVGRAAADGQVELVERATRQADVLTVDAALERVLAAVAAT